VRMRVIHVGSKVYSLIYHWIIHPNLRLAMPQCLTSNHHNHPAS
jgi:hypothetical protein